MAHPIDLRWQADNAGQDANRRILLVYGHTPYTPGRYLADAFHKAGADVTTVSDAQSMVPARDFDATIWVESPSRPTPDFAQFNDLPRPRLAWLHHGEHRLEANLAVTAAFDPDIVLLAHSLHLADRFSRRTGFLPFGWDPDLFPPGIHWEDRQLDFAFVGSGLGRRSVGDYARRNRHLRTARQAVSRRRRIIKTGLYLEDLSAVYRRARVVMNDSADTHRAINMRLWEAMGSGALVLTEKIPSQDLLFENGTHYLEFENCDELRERLRWIGLNRDLAGRVARAGHREVVARHRYSNRVERILEWIEDLK